MKSGQFVSLALCVINFLKVKSHMLWVKFSSKLGNIKLTCALSLLPVILQLFMLFVLFQQSDFMARFSFRAIQFGFRLKLRRRLSVESRWAVQQSTVPSQQTPSPLGSDQLRRTDRGRQVVTGIINRRCFYHGFSLSQQQKYEFLWTRSHTHWESPSTTSPILGRDEFDRRLSACFSEETSRNAESGQLNRAGWLPLWVSFPLRPPPSLPFSLSSLLPLRKTTLQPAGREDVSLLAVFDIPLFVLMMSWFLSGFGTGNITLTGG